MPGVADILREIHRLRRHAREMQQEIDRSPIVLKAHKNKMEKAEAAAAECTNALKKLKVATHEKEVSLKSTVQQIAKYEKQQDDVTDMKQMDALKHQIAAAKEKVSVLEDEILNALGEIDERTAKLPEQDKAAATAKTDFANFEKEHKERIARLAEELKTALAGIAEVEAGVPADMKQHYQRMINAFGPTHSRRPRALTCSYCHAQITSQQQIEVQAGMFVLCRSCGRGLYLPE